MVADDALTLAALESHDPRAPQKQGERRFCCPLCGAGKKIDAAHRSLAVNMETGAWNCHRCGQSGRLREFWEERAAPHRPARRGRRPIVLPPEPAPVSQEWKAELRGLAPVSGTPAERYLMGRGIAAVAAHAGGVRFAPSWYGSPAVVFPVRDKAGNLAAAQGRYLDGRRQPKTRSAGSIKSGVFASGGAWDAPALILTEAPIDALSLAACGFPALALCGSSMMPAWVPARCAFRPVLLAFDADEAGDKAAASWAGALAPYTRRAARLRPERGKDWNEVLTSSGRFALSLWLEERILETEEELVTGEEADLPPTFYERVCHAFSPVIRLD